MRSLARAVTLPVGGQFAEPGAETLVDLDVVELIAGRSLWSDRDGYATLRVDGAPFSLHRFVLGLQRGDGKLVDHKNRDRLDNRRENLRLATHAQNSANRNPKGPSGHIGVRWRRGKWEAWGVQLNGKPKPYLGRFTDLSEAAQVAGKWRLDNYPGYEEVG